MRITIQKASKGSHYMGIPIDIAKAMKLEPGDVLDVEHKDGLLILRKSARQFEPGDATLIRVAKRGEKWLKFYLKRSFMHQYFLWDKHQVGMWIEGEKIIINLHPVCRFCTHLGETCPIAELQAERIPEDCTHFTTSPTPRGELKISARRSGLSRSVRGKAVYIDSREVLRALAPKGIKITSKARRFKSLSGDAFKCYEKQFCKKCNRVTEHLVTVLDDKSIYKCLNCGKRTS
jgi:antitoxin component of MazEF toxin-antitoxin module